MRTQRSKLLLAGMSAALLGTSSMVPAHEVPDPVDTAPITDSVPDQPASSVAQASAESQDGSTRTQSSVMERDQANTNSQTSTPDGATSASDSTSAGSTSMERDQSSRAAGAGGGQGDSLWILMPVALETQSDQMTQGCWVRLYSGDNFEGRYLTIAGPAEVRELRSPYGTGMNNWESAVVGPRATVTTYDDQEFRARNATLRPGMRYAELDDSKLGLFEDIESLRVQCGGQGAGSSRSGGGSS